MFWHSDKMENNVNRGKVQYKSVEEENKQTVKKWAAVPLRSDESKVASGRCAAAS